MNTLQDIVQLIKGVPNNQQLGGLIRDKVSLIEKAQVVQSFMFENYKDEIYSLGLDKNLTFNLAGYDYPEKALREKLSKLGFEEGFTDDEDCGQLFYYVLKGK